MTKTKQLCPEQPNRKLIIYDNNYFKLKTKPIIKILSNYNNNNNSSTTTNQLNKELEFVIYNDEFFKSNNKFTTTTTKPQIQTDLLRIPKKAIQPIPIINNQIPLQILLKDIDKNLLERFYKYNRLIEFCKVATTILNNRLLPNYSKFGHWMYLGSCPLNLIKTLFSHQQCLTWDVVRKKKQGNFYTIQTKTFYYFNIMPDLLVNSNWWINYLPICNTYHYKEIRSYYKEIIFIINDDDRVWFHFSQVTQYKYKNIWIDTA